MRHKNSNASETSDKETDVVRTKVFNFHSVRSTIITKLHKRTSQNNTMLEYKADTGSDGNLMLISMFKSLFPKCISADRNKSKNKN